MLRNHYNERDESLDLFLGFLGGIGSVEFALVIMHKLGKFKFFASSFSLSLQELVPGFLFFTVTLIEFFSVKDFVVFFVTNFLLVLGIHFITKEPADNTTPTLASPIHKISDHVTVNLHTNIILAKNTGHKTGQTP
eukprot:m.180419 g.180419  ORF g.180419 m.180419 type:complete len:136 (+) comp15499_c1_seq2:745-1152(+)